MEMLAKQFIGKECLVYTVTDTMGSIQGTVKEVPAADLFWNVAMACRPSIWNM